MPNAPDEESLASDATAQRVAGTPIGPKQPQAIAVIALLTAVIALALTVWPRVVRVTPVQTSSVVMTDPTSDISIVTRVEAGRGIVVVAAPRGFVLPVSFEWRDDPSGPVHVAELHYEKLTGLLRVVEQ